MEENGAQNGAEGAKRRVKFGTEGAQSVPHEWAESMLMYLFKHNGPAFRDALMHAVGLHLPARGRAKADV